MTFAAWEQIVLALLVMATIAVFGRDLSAKVRSIRAGSSDRPRTDRLGQRIARLVREVLMQWRVVGGRPIAGLMHASVFLGFLVFALETVDHFLEPFGVPFLETLFGGALPAFRMLLAFLAVLVGLAIIGLAFRRFVLVKISPDPRSYSSGIVALLILLLMVTYLNGVRAEPVLEKANWWLHTLIIIAFPHLILRSKHFHILIAPVTIFFRTHRLGDYLPLDLDLDNLSKTEQEISLGLETVDDLPWKMRMDFLTCVECKRCTEQCPAWNCGQELDPRGFILAGRAALDSSGSVIGNIISETALGQCTSCGACENICPVGIEHLQFLLGAKRAQALATGKGMVAAEFLQTVDRYGNPFSAATQSKTELLRELGVPLFEKGKTEYLLWLGCVWGYNADARSSLQAMLKVLDRAGVSYGVLEDESCSGHHSRRQGEELQFQTLANANISLLQNHAVGKVISPCPHCLHTIRREYPTLSPSLSVEVTHHSEFVARLVEEGRLQLRRQDGNGKLTTFHDPCYLGRYEGVYEAPRNVIRSTGSTLVELPRSRARSFCCGGGNAGFASQREEKQRVDQARSEEIASSGAGTLITACPECRMMLNTAVEETKDLAELVAESIE